jgi:hypothetical protein
VQSQKKMIGICFRYLIQIKKLHYKRNEASLYFCFKKNPISDLQSLPRIVRDI